MITNLFTMISLKRRITFLFVILTFFSCRKDQNDKEVVPQDEVLSVQDHISLDNAKDMHLSLNRIYLPNGILASDFLSKFDTTFFQTLGVQDNIQDLKALAAKNFLIKKLSAVALNIVDREKHQFTEDGPNQPSQNGYAYVYGSREIATRKKPVGSCKDQELFGLDCSGLMFQLFKQAGIETFPSTTADEQRKPENIKKALNKSLPQLKKIKVEDLKQLSTEKFKTGDLIYWIDGKSVKDVANPHETGRAQHIGMILKTTNGDLAVFQSNGDPSGKDNCEKNKGLNRGPRIIKMDDKYWFGKGKIYGIVRFNFEIEGKWTFHFKCADKPQELFVINLDFPPSSSKAFEIKKGFTDYDGSHNTASFMFKFDNTSNALSCDFIITDGNIPGFERKDSFNTVLEVDDSGFLSAKNLYINNGTGCLAEVKLINVQ